MGGTKIFVLQMKDVLRTAVFAVLGLMLIILLVVLFIPKGSDEADVPSSQYIPGRYSSSIILNAKPVDVSVTVSDEEITSVEIAEFSDVQQTFYPLFEPEMSGLAEDVLYYQSADIAPASDNPVTSGILRQAVSAALEQAQPGMNP